uniref:TIR domain-containing protein n=1 Tax=Biomphalaria glabrata TaxID=6526 RepID=A0A2C9L8X1_BIOGL
NSLNIDKQSREASFVSSQFNHTFEKKFESKLTTNDDSPCRIKNAIIDCSGLSLTKLNSSWFPSNSEVINLSSNELTTLENSAFNHLINLIQLNIEYNKLTRIEPRAFDGLQSLKMLALSFNSLQFNGASISIDSFKPLRNLEELGLLIVNIVVALHPLFTVRSFANLKVIAINNDFRPCIWSSFFQGHSNINGVDWLIDQETNATLKDMLETNKSSNHRNNYSDMAKSRNESKQISQPSHLFPVPKNLVYVQLSRLIQSTSVDLNIQVMNGENIEYIDLTDNGLHDFVGSVTGLTSLKVLALSGNNMVNLNPDFFDELTGLEYLALSKAGLNRDFVSSFSRRLFQNLSNLTRLDLSINYLNALSKGTFSPNSKLQWLDLSGNQFKDIPFDLQYTPNLLELDVSSNALTTIDDDIARDLDHLVATNGQFHLSLGGNILSCSCSDLRFLQWLNLTSVTFDHSRNYTCLNKDGEKAYTLFYSDLDSLWRECWGQYFLYVAVIIVCLYVIGFFVILLLLRNKHFLVSYFLKILGNIKLLKRTDYPIHVYIAYSDIEYKFSCSDLREYIEGTLKLNTFLNDRDLISSLNSAADIVKAMNSSWKILLVCSASFLNGDWAMLTLRSAIYAQSPTNPARIMVLVHQNDLLLLPHDLLSVVDDENMLIISEWKVDYVMREWLRTRLTDK